ncbi:MAG: rhodanese-like domain-containing protein [Pseudomonadota bacterium]
MSSPIVPSVSINALARLLAKGASVTLVDVRKAPAFESDPVFIPGAVTRDPTEVANWGASLPDDRPVIVNCVHGHEVSQGVVAGLVARGLDARFLEGGIDAWIRAGHHTVDAR